MKMYHNSRDSRFRSPFGAVKTGETVKLRLDAEDCSDGAEAKVRIWCCEEERFYPMEIKRKGKTLICRAEIDVPSEPCLLWYSFCLTDEGGEHWYVNTSRLGGEGGEAACGDDNNYQITVYDKDFTVPEWFVGQVMYQIFPDRFFGVHDNGVIEKSRDEYIIHYDRYEHLSFNLHPHEAGPACNDFYGGNLKGIIAKLPYIKSLGVGVIYLNPIFEAYSNHKYDTANYKRIDPMFGTEEDFSKLCSEAEKLGIRIILDGVFSHTGADSIYFNKYGYYGDGGAYRDENSLYRSWYGFDQNGNYTSWWGCSNLPNVNEMDPSYLDYILRDENSVIKKWLRLGASGWRLDVADELPDEFIQILRREVKKVKPDAVVIGEVWEDASNKIAYGEQRKYLLGRELDSVMNYPFKDNVTAYIMGFKSAKEADNAIMSIMENYPLSVVYSLMNLLGTHDTMRIKSMLGGLGSECGCEKLSSGMEDLATYRLLCAAFMQMTMPGVPSIYYGDEVGMQGGRDPFCRAPYPWRGVDVGLLEKYRELGTLRQKSSVLKTGFFKTLSAEEAVYVYARYFENNTDVFGNPADESFALCAVNRSFEPQTVKVDLSEFNPGRLYFDGRAECELKPCGKYAEFTVPPVGYIYLTNKIN